MKNLKKVLAMVLAFACTFTMFASAKMYEDVQPGTEFSEAITMLSDLGIIQGKTDNKYHPEDTITRAEACALIARLMTGDPNAAGFNGAHHFKDVPAGHWASSAIGYAVVNGIAVGVDQAGTRFEPNRPIKDKEFVTMIVRALGYETPDMRNNFPFGYMSAARAIGLLQDVNMVPDTDALRGEDAQVIYNAMFVDYARGAKRVNVAHGTTVETYPTLAEDVWHLNRAALGTWNKKDNEDVTLSNCKAHTWVILGEAQDEENAVLALAIDDNDETKLYEAKDAKTQQKYKAYKFKYEGTADIDALRGYKVELWGAGKHGEPVWEKDGEKFVYSTDWKIKAIKTVKNQTKFDYNPSMADRKSKDGSIELNEETKLSLGSAADNAQLVKQEQGVKEVVTFAADVLNTIKVKNDESLEEALNVRNGMQYKLIDWNNDKEIDWVVVDEARYYKVESATSKRVNVTSMAGDNLKSDKDSVTETWKLDESEKIGKNLAGKDVKVKYEAPEGLKEGDIVEVTYKVAYDGAQMITATVKVVDAENEKLEKVATRDGLTLTFGDKEVKIAQNARKDGGDVIVPANPEKYAGFNGEELGTEFALTKNRNGFIVYSDYATETANYMMVLNTAGGKDTTGDRDLAVIDFVDGDNKEHKDVKVSSSVRVLDKGGDTLTGAYKDRQFDEAKVVGNVFKYWTDADGVITKMQAMFDTNLKNVQKSAAYKYDADADRLIDVDSNNNYVASLEDAKVIFAVKHNYIREDLKTSKPVLGNDNLYVDSADVLATKQKDIPDIGTDPEDVAMLGDALNTENAWLGNENTDYRFAAQVDKNGDATAAVLGVENFNKFNAGATKLALVTNVSENSKGIVEAEVAYNGEITTLASAEKQDFEDIVKVFDGRNDQDVTGTDARIDAPGNDIFHGEKLSEVVNQSGQYAEVTTDKDGKLTKVVFMDGEDPDAVDPAFSNTNTNKLTGHHYTVSRNLVLKVNDKNLKYHLNDNKMYGKDLAIQRYAGEDNKLQTVTRLPDQSAGYADDAKFYQIDSAPTRHDKNYEGTRLTVNAGFNDIENTDVKVIEKKDIGASDFDRNSKKNVYEVADLAFNGDGDLVAVYSFKKDMDQKDDYEYVAPAKDYKVTGIQFVKNNGTTGADLETIPGHKNQFVVYVTGVVQGEKDTKVPVVGLTKDNFEVMFGGADGTVRIKDVTANKDAAGYYTITLDKDVDTTKAVIVTVVKAGHAAEIVDGGVKVEDKTPEFGVEGTTPDANISEAAKKVVDFKVTVDKGGLAITPMDADGKSISGMEQGDFAITVNGNVMKLPMTIDPATNTWKTDMKDFNFSSKKDVTVTVGTVKKTYAEVGGGSAAIMLSGTADFEKGSKDDVTFTPRLVNLDKKDLELKGEKDTENPVPAGVSYNAETGVITVKAEALNKLPVGETLKFQLVRKGHVEATKDYVVTVVAPSLQHEFSEVVVGTKAEAEEYASAKYTVKTTKDNEKFDVQVNDASANQWVEVAAGATAEATAQKIQTALDAALDKALYTVTTASDTFTVTAKGDNKKDVTVKIHAKNVTVEDTDVKPYKAPVEAVAGNTVLTISTEAAAKADAGEWTVAVGTQNVKITVREGDAAAKIAENIARAGRKNGKLTFVNKGNTVVISEKSGEEGKFLVADTKVTFTKNP